MAAGAYEAALVDRRGGLAVAWYDTRDGNAEIYLRLLDEHGQPAGPERRLTETPDASYEASLERLGDTFIVAWYEQTTDGRQTAMLGAWNRDGTRKWTQAIAPGSQESGDRHRWTRDRGRLDSGRAGRHRSRVGRLPGARTAQSSARGRAWAPASKTTWNLNLALDGSDAWVVFDAATSTRASELFLGRVDASGVHLDRLTRDDGAESKYPDLKIGDGGASRADVVRHAGRQ